MSLDPRMILQGVQAGIQNAQPVTNLLSGVQQQQQLAGEDQRQRLLEQQVEQQAALAPLQQQALAQKIQAGQMGIDAANVQAEQATRDGVLTGVFNIASQANALPADQQAEFVRNNVSQFDIPGVQDFTDELSSMSDEQIIETLPRVLAEGQRLGLGSKAIGKTASQKDFETYQALKKTDPEKAKEFGRQSGFIRPTEQEKADIKVDETTRKEVAKATAARKQGFVDSGVEAADSTANIRRSMQLLGDIKTGGFDAVALRAKQAFGVEGGDEGELSANLGKAVLAQLKPIFGAAFTAAEGERLERIEASLSRSPATNKRLLGNALKIAERAARRGLAAAEDLGDEFTADEIRNSLEFELTPAGEQASAPSIDDLVNKYAN